MRQGKKSQGSPDHRWEGLQISQFITGCSFKIVKTKKTPKTKTIPEEMKKYSIILILSVYIVYKKKIVTLLYPVKMYKYHMSMRGVY